MNSKILLIRLSAMGDVIFSLPTLAAVRSVHPGAEISWVVEDKAATLLAHRGDLAGLIVYPRKAMQQSMRNPFRWPRLIGILWKHFRALRQEQFDAVYDLQGNLKSGLHTLCCRSKRKIGYAKKHVKELNHLFTNEHISQPAKAIHRIEKSFCLVKPDYDSNEIQRPDLFLPDEVKEEARKRLEGWLEKPGPIMVAHPGTSAFGAYKRWPPEKYGRLAARLHEEHGFKTLVTWGPGEQELAEAVAETGGKAVTVCPPTRSLQELAAHIEMARVYVSADSGPLHIANYLGVPCLALFGPKDPALYKPYFPLSRVVRRTDVDCSPCTRRTCDDPICMTGLEVDEVYESLCGLLKESDCRS
ncbi:MAG: glycosyltransferase family 9 protein [Planctomycetota bacterium]|jgi:lipopolysaccharide heptosyltransferase I